MDAKDLFCAKLDELGCRSRTPDDPSQPFQLNEYDVVRCAEILRHLFLDSPRLLDQARKGLDFTDEYVVSAPTATRRDDPDLPADLERVFGLDPEDAQPETPTTINLGRDDFLGIPLRGSDGHQATVSDLIKFVAHIEGGVHSGKPKGDVEVGVERDKNNLRRFGLDNVHLQVRSVARVVVTALRPIRQQLESTT